jgi:hypothetical protein
MFTLFLAVRWIPIGIKYFPQGIQGKSEIIALESSQEKTHPYR